MTYVVYTNWLSREISWIDRFSTPKTPIRTNKSVNVRNTNMHDCPEPVPRHGLDLAQRSQNPIPMKRDSSPSFAGVVGENRTCSVPALCGWEAMVRDTRVGVFMSTTSLIHVILIIIVCNWSLGSSPPPPSLAAERSDVFFVLKLRTVITYSGEKTAFRSENNLFGTVRHSISSSPTYY